MIPTKKFLKKNFVSYVFREMFFEQIISMYGGAIQIFADNPRQRGLVDGDTRKVANLIKKTKRPKRQRRTPNGPSRSSRTGSKDAAAVAGTVLGANYLSRGRRHIGPSARGVNTLRRRRRRRRAFAP